MTQLKHLDLKKFPAIHRKVNEIKAQLALGTLDINSMNGTDFLAIGCPITDPGAHNLLMAIQPIWIKERRFSYTGKDGFMCIRKAASLMFTFPGMTDEFREARILIQEKILKDAKEDPEMELDSANEWVRKKGSN